MSTSKLSLKQRLTDAWANACERVRLTKEFFVAVFGKSPDSLHTSDDGLEQAVDLNLKNDVSISRSVRIIATIFSLVLIFVVWANLFSIDEVSKGDGKVVPSSKEQVIQSLDGGILTEMFVKEGEIVKAGQILAQLDTTRTSSNVEESAAKYRAVLASLARLESEVNGGPLRFSAELNDFPELVASERKLYQSRKEKFDSAISNIRDSRELIHKELAINTRLAAAGAASTVDVIRLKRQLVDLDMKESEMNAEYYVKAREEMAKVSAEVQSLAPVVKGREDLISKSTMRSPVRGIVNNIEITTIGGVIPPNGSLMNIVPLDDTLLIEARISPRDIAFIHPDQLAKVKITAYDYSIYGSLDGKVATISPDTTKDEQKPDVVYYRVYIRTDKDHLTNKHDQKFFITPGMVATVDIKTGSKTVAQYLMKPFNKVNEALRER